MSGTASDPISLCHECLPGLMKSVVSAKHAMLLVWKLAASTTEPWTANVDGVVKRLVENLVKLFSVILDCPPVSEALERQQESQPTPAVQTASLYQVSLHDGA